MSIDYPNTHTGRTMDKLKEIWGEEGNTAMGMLLGDLDGVLYKVVAARCVCKQSICLSKAML